MVAVTADARGRGVATDDRRAQEHLIALMGHYKVRLYTFLLVLVRDPELAQDCAQDAFVRAYDNLRRGKPVNSETHHRPMGRNAPRSYVYIQERVRVHGLPAALKVGRSYGIGSCHLWSGHTPLANVGSPSQGQDLGPYHH